VIIVIVVLDITNVVGFVVVARYFNFLKEFYVHLEL
jgi:hypothetical protein